MIYGRRNKAKGVENDNDTWGKHQIDQARADKATLDGWAWQGAKSVGRKTIKLTYRMKQRIARELGYKLADAVDTVRETK